MLHRFLITVGLLPVTAMSAAAPPDLAAVPQIERPAEVKSPSDASAIQIDAAGPRIVQAAPPVDPDIDRRPLQQVTTGLPTADAAPPLSSTDQSRPEPRTILVGEDRCDPATRDRLPSATCAKVVETRSAEFDRRPVPLSPEQRLLLEQRTAVATDSQGAARRLATGEATQGDQAIASIAVRSPLPAADGKEDDKAPLTKEQAAAIVGAILNQPPQ